MRYLILLSCIMLFSCSTSQWIETSLYFGQSKPDGGKVTEADWNKFKENKVSKVFPEGSTVVNVTGNWYDPAAKQLITEPTYVVISYHKKSPGLSKQVDSLRYWYKTMFQQQSVLRVDKKVKASF
jgi:hypothetical protein